MSATPIEISVGGSRWASSWAQDLMTWEDFTESLSARMYNNASTETHAEYMALSKAEQDKRKDGKRCQSLTVTVWHKCRIKCLRNNQNLSNINTILRMRRTRMSAIINLGQFSKINMSINLRGTNVAMTEHFLYRAQIATAR